MQVILASASPRRQAILNQIGVTFVVRESGADESLIGMEPLEAPRILAERKALAVSIQEPDKVVLGYDTLVFCDGFPLGKPVDAQEAERMLTNLKGRWHEVRTGFALAIEGKIVQSGQECTRVLFRLFTKTELDDYIATTEPYDKAGAYGIQGLGARFVHQIEGCYYNVVGLPVAKTLDALHAIAET
jgi:septum formation protein